MKLRQISTIFAGMLVLTAVAAPAKAALVPVAPACTNGGALAAMDPDAIACSGAFSGNDANQQSDVAAEIASAFASITGAGTWAFGEKVDAGASGALIQSVPGATSGTISFVNPVTDFFTLSLKAANQFSLYLFDGGAGGVSSVDFTTIGTSVNPKGKAQDLSHASLWTFTSDKSGETGDPEPIPLPAGILLLASAIAGVGLMNARRK